MPYPSTIPTLEQLYQELSLTVSTPTRAETSMARQIRELQEELVELRGQSEPLQDALNRLTEELMTAREQLAYALRLVDSATATSDTLRYRLTKLYKLLRRESPNTVLNNPDVQSWFDNEGKAV